MFRRRFTALALALALAPVLPSPARARVVVGPPWITIELPANPLDPATKGAFLLVRTYHHDKSIPFAVEGRAEGIVNGQRRTLPLRFDATSKEGVLALRKSWPAEGAWVLVITGMPGEGSVTALVSIAEDGEVRQVRVPSRTVENGRWTVPTPVSQAEVETALRNVAGMATLGAR
jgi:hypothetical protein